MSGDIRISSREEIRLNYDRLSGWYDFISGGAEGKIIHTGLDLLAARKDEKIFEPGFGTGHALLQLARSVGSAGRIFGVDLSPRMAAIAKARIRKAGLQDRVEITCSDAAQLSFSDSFLDAVFCSFTLELFSDQEIGSILSEWKRVLRPGGRIIIISLLFTEHPNLISRFYQKMRKRHPSLIDCRPIKAAALLSAAGFKIEEEREMALWWLPVSIISAIKPTTA